eukprot:TRINITY_DN17594_c0_g1_i2.p1 TRINITY_DN17594_c0_g1~~TRINITY_DN17594_c0_g1_i2.p1  ORF type:complete len:179 (+),score=19.05 TRINITY_DN17594_c0_g1_i2:149-685(+)
MPGIMKFEITILLVILTFNLVAEAKTLKKHKKKGCGGCLACIPIIEAGIEVASCVCTTCDLVKKLKQSWAKSGTRPKLRPEPRVGEAHKLEISEPGVEYAREVFSEAEWDKVMSGIPLEGGIESIHKKALGKRIGAPEKSKLEKTKFVGTEPKVSELKESKPMKTMSRKKACKPGEQI